MSFKNRDIKVILSQDAIVVYNELNKIVGEELKKGIKSSEHQTLLRAIKRVRDRIKDNPFAGDQVEKKKIPKKYIQDYGVKNVWRIELSSYWRLIYTIKSDEITIINFVLNIVDHNKYNKIFGYKKK